MISPKMDRYDYRHMYKRFIETSNEDYQLTLGKINHYSSLLNKLKFNIESRRDEVRSIFGICLYNFWEWNTDEPDANHRLENNVDKVYAMFSEAKQLKYGDIYNTFKRYFVVIGKLKTSKNLLIRIKNRKDITLVQFRTYLYRYYEQVNREVLRGKIVKFNNKLGCALIERVRRGDVYNSTGNLMKRKKMIDWQTTRKNKAKLIEEDKIPYNHDDAIAAKRKGVPYNGVEYVAYLQSPWWCQLVLIDANFKFRGLFKFIPCNKRTVETCKVMMSKCNSIEDIIKYPIDTMARLSMIIKFDETYTIKYIRNDEQRGITDRRHNCPFR